MFLCCGDSLFDVFAETGEEVSRIDLQARIGGSALNAALGLARLGHPVAFFGKISNDLYGRQLRAFMSRESIDQSFLIPTGRNTTLAIVSLSAAGVPQYSFYIEGTADRSVVPEEVPETLAPEVTAIHLGGSYTTVSEPTSLALSKLVSQEKDRLFISYDPNIRASIVPDLDVWRVKVSEFVACAALVKASDEDLAQLYPNREIEDVLAEWVSMGAGLAVCTRGEKGAMARSATGTSVSVEGVRVEVVDTVGAGDTFFAAMLSKLAEDGRLSRAGLAELDAAGLESLIGFAVKAAAVTCGRRGADLPRRADLGLGPLAS